MRTNKYFILVIVPAPGGGLRFRRERRDGRRLARPYQSSSGVIWAITPRFVGGCWFHESVRVLVTAFAVEERLFQPERKIAEESQRPPAPDAISEISVDYCALTVCFLASPTPARGIVPLLAPDPRFARDANRRSRQDDDRPR